MRPPPRNRDAQTSSESESVSVSTSSNSERLRFLRRSCKKLRDIFQDVSGGSTSVDLSQFQRIFRLLKLPINTQNVGLLFEMLEEKGLVSVEDLYPHIDHALKVPIPHHTDDLLRDMFLKMQPKQRARPVPSITDSTNSHEEKIHLAKALEHYRREQQELSSWLQSSPSPFALVIATGSTSDTDGSESYRADSEGPRESSSDFEDSEYEITGSEQSFRRIPMEGFASTTPLNIIHWTYFDVLHWLAAIQNGRLQDYLPLFKTEKIDGEKLTNEPNEYFESIGVAPEDLQILRQEIETARDYFSVHQNFDELVFREQRNVHRIKQVLVGQNLPPDELNSLSIQEILSWAPDHVFQWVMTIQEIARTSKKIYADNFLRDYVDGQRLLQMNADEIAPFVSDPEHADIILRHVEVLKNMAPEQLRSLFGTSIDTRVSERVCQTSITFTKRPFGFFVDDRFNELLVGNQIVPDSEADLKGVKPGWVVFSVNRQVLHPSMSLERCRDLLTQASLPCLVDFLFYESDNNWGDNDMRDRQRSIHIQQKRAELVSSQVINNTPTILLKDDVLKELNTQLLTDFNVQYDTRIYGEEPRIFRVDVEEYIVKVRNPAYTFQVPAEVPFQFFSFPDATTACIKEKNKTWTYYFLKDADLSRFKELLDHGKTSSLRNKIRGAGLQVDAAYFEAEERKKLSDKSKSVLLWTLSRKEPPLDMQFNRLVSRHWIPNHKPVLSGSFATFGLMNPSDEPEPHLVSPLSDKRNPFFNHLRHCACNFEAVAYPLAFACWFLLGLALNIFNLVTYYNNSDLYLPPLRTCLINIIVCILMRAVWFTNYSTLFFACFRSKFMHEIGESIEGLHISTSVFVFAWFIIYLVHDVKDVKSDLNYLYAFMLPCFLASPLITSIPYARRLYHNQFYIYHRYMTYTSVLLLLTHVVIGEVDGIDATSDILTNTNFWLSVAIAILLYLPSFFVRYYSAEEIQVRCFSPHMIELCFPGNRRPGDYVKISTNLREWHVFPVVEQKYKATDDYSRNIVSNLSKGSIASRFQLVSDAQGPSYYVVHIGGHGTWTKAQILKAQSSFETLNFPLNASTVLQHSYSCFVGHYTNLLVVVSGAGIGAATALMNSIEDTVRKTVKIVWFAHKPKVYFAPIFEDLKEKANVTIVDTSKVGVQIPEKASNFVHQNFNECDVVFTFLSRTKCHELRRRFRFDHAHLPVYIPTF